MNKYISNTNYTLNPETTAFGEYVERPIDCITREVLSNFEEYNNKYLESVSKSILRHKKMIYFIKY